MLQLPPIGTSETIYGLANGVNPTNPTINVVYFIKGLQWMFLPMKFGIRIY